LKILAISPVLPYPPADGDRIRIYRFLEQLSKRHSITLVSFIRKGEEGNARQLKKICKEIYTVPISGPEIFLNTAKALLGGLPMNVAAYESEKMREAIDEAMIRACPDILYVYRLRMAPYAEGRKLPKVIDIVDAMSLFNLRRMDYEKNIFRLMYSAIDGPRLLFYERSLEARFSHVFINSGEDAKYLGLRNVVTAQNGSDGAPKKAGKEKGVFTIGFFGNMGYAPNMDAFLYFYKKVWKKPAVSDNNIKLVLAGATAGRLLKLAGPRVEIKGYIADIDAEISSWDAAIVPVRYGAGRQNKIMKAWSCGVPVVATPFAARGVYGRDRQNLLIAKDEDEFAGKILSLMKDKKLAGRLVAGGKSTVKRYFDWKKSGKIIDQVLRKDAKSKK
jgi:glycosyltransferase involved in cell wall biosynthesis